MLPEVLWGAVLSQKSNKGELRPVAFASRKTYKAESNYPAHRLEFLALRWAVTVKFKDYLQYSQFRVLTDSNPLAYILKKLEVDAVSQRWAADLSRFDFQVLILSIEAARVIPQLIAYPDLPNPTRMKERSSFGAVPNVLVWLKLCYKCKAYP